MNFRFLISLLTCWMICGSAGASDGPIDLNAVAENVAELSFEQLKQVGASRSKYLQHKFDANKSDTKSKAPHANLDAFKADVRPLLERACVQCHGPDVQEGNVRIDTLDPDLLHGQDVDWWLEIMAVLSNGEMPPPDAGDLVDDDRSKIVEWLSNEVQVASTVRRAAGGHSSFRRMTRYEYNYAMQDILGLPWDFAKDLPPEAHSDDGFQNSSEMLHMSVMQLETYRQLARKALLRTTDRGERPPVIHWGITMKEAAERQWTKQEQQVEKLKEKFKDDPAKRDEEVEKLMASFTKPHSRPFYRDLSSARTARAEWAYHGARYAFKPSDSQSPFPPSFDHVAVLPHGRKQYLTVELGDTVPNQGMMRVRIRASKSSVEENRVPSLQLEFGFQASNEGKAVVRVSQADTPIGATADNPEIYQWDVPLGEIYPRNSFRKLSKMGALPSPSEYIRFVNSSAPQGQHGDIQIDYVEVTAPVYDQWPTESHSRIFFESSNSANETTYAREILTAFMSQAWRRPVGGEAVDRKVELFQAMRQECDSFEEAMIEALAVVLSSPEFLYVVQEQTAPPKNNEDDTTVESGRLSNHQLATRLSLFLWCSIPDDELLTVANNGQLHDAEVLSQQVERMLADSRSKRFARHFVHQWLDMQLLDFLSLNDKSDPLLKEAMLEEPVAFFQEVLRSNDSVLNFVHADYTMANERIALHCGVPDVRGNHFRRVELDVGKKRGGLMTQPGLLAMNSAGKDSHPLKRGVWLLESLLNDPPPPPPPAVPEIDLADPEIAKLTLKQQIEDHRNHAACMSCHAKIDPWGIAFENYDAMGRWREKINGQPVDATSELFNNQKLNGMDGLKKFLLANRQDQFVRALVHKLATYGLGRPLTFTDYASIDNVTADVRRQGDGLAELIQLLVASELFRTR